MVGVKQNQGPLMHGTVKIYSTSYKGTKDVTLDIEIDHPITGKVRAKLDREGAKQLLVATKKYLESTEAEDAATAR